MTNMKGSNRYHKAIIRNLYEVANASMELKVLIAFEDYSNNKHIFTKGESFFTISFRALFNDMIAHVIKVLDTNRESANFWYILRVDGPRVKKLKSYSKERINSLKILAEKLKIVRDKTHFHIDKKGVLNPNDVWEMADIKGKELSEGLFYLFSILNEIHQIVLNKSFLFNPEDYDGTDLAKLIDFADANRLIMVTPKVK